MFRHLWKDVSRKNGRFLFSPPHILNKFYLNSFLALLALALIATYSIANASPAGSISHYDTATQYTGTPTFRIAQVKTDESVTIETTNFPANQTFTVTMGRAGTQGVNGITVGTLNSGTDGTVSATFNIPAELKGLSEIAIRTQTSHAVPYYAYNWFYNNTTNPTPPPTPNPTPTPPPPATTGTPTFKICSVTKDQNVTIVTNNFPANQQFTVTMGAMYTQGIGGTVVGTLDSGAGGTLTATFNIPAGMQGASRIAIRAQTAHANPFYAFNWFWNTTASVCN